MENKPIDNGKSSDSPCLNEGDIDHNNVLSVIQELEKRSYWGENNQILRAALFPTIPPVKGCNSQKTELMKKEKETKEYSKKLLLDLLEVIDAFDRVFQNIEFRNQDMDKNTKIWMGNFKSIKRLVEKILKNSAVTAIESSNRKAVPGFHTIIETRQMDGFEDDSIIEEVERGYLWHEEVLRKSKVIAVKNSQNS